VKLPAGVLPGAPPTRLQLTEEQIERFDRDGFILIPGAVKEWVEFLRAVSDFQVEYPHVLALSASLRGSYDYIHINTWMTNNGIRDFMYYSALGHILAQLGRTTEVRISTDNLLVNPHKCFGWHQDNQTGPIDPSDALRFWAAMDPCSPGLGAPEFLLGSHRQAAEVARDTSFVNLGGDGNMWEQCELAEPSVEPGDLLVWHAQTIHQLVVPTGRPWDGEVQRRVISGTAVKHGATYWRRTLSGVMGDASGHELEDGEALGGPYFPRIFPDRVSEEEQVRARGELVPRSPLKVFERKLQAQWQVLTAGAEN